MLDDRFYDRDPRIVARALLGLWLVSRTADGITGGRIVETEAYLASGDPACHAAKGQNRKNAAMFGPPGTAYVYVIHARHCFNVVTQPVGTGSAVLVRALEPLWGIDLMVQRRGRAKPRELTTGPARLCEALAIDRRLSGKQLTQRGELWIQASHDSDPSSPHLQATHLQTPRIGVTSGHELAYRYVERGNPFVSGPLRLRL